MNEADVKPSTLTPSDISVMPSNILKNERFNILTIARMNKYILQNYHKYYKSTNKEVILIIYLIKYSLISLSKNVNKLSLLENSDSRVVCLSVFLQNSAKVQFLLVIYRLDFIGFSFLYYIIFILATLASI